MARSPLFSTYRGGENRVTSSLIAVFERIDPRLVEQILAAAAGESTTSLLSFANQRRKHLVDVPFKPCRSAEAFANGFTAGAVVAMSGHRRQCGRPVLGRSASHRR